MGEGVGMIHDNPRHEATQQADNPPDALPVGIDDWRYEVLNDDTRLGFKEWLAHREESLA